MSKDIIDVPEQKTTIKVLALKSELEKVEEKAETVGCEKSRVVRQGINTVIADGLDGDTENLERSAEKIQRSIERLEDAEQTTAYHLDLYPVAKVALDIAQERFNDLKAVEDPIRQRHITSWAVEWAANELDPSDIHTEDPFSQNGDFEFFSKLPGRDRGGLPIRMEINKESGKEKLAERAKQQEVKPSEAARTGIRKIIEMVEKNPAQARRFIEEDREYYSSPTPHEYSYGYQVYIDALTKRRLTRVKRLINEETRGEEITQRDLLQAAARWVIEEYVSLEATGLNPDA